jgi:hypothetical protein
MRRSDWQYWTALLGLCISASAYGGSMTYTVTPNADVCHDMRLGRFTVPSGAAPVSNVSTGYCHPELRSAGETQLYVTAACHQRGDTWLPAPQKYSVDLNRSRAVRRISEAEWQAAPQLPWNGTAKGIIPNAQDRGVQYKGPLLERSGPRWQGIGGGSLLPETFLSQSASRAAVNSWDGFDITYSFLDPTSFGKRNKVEGQYWVDIYETSSGRALLRIRGSFHGAEPYQFQGQAAWYSDRYYVIPVGGTMGSGEFSLRRLLICDIDAAARKGDTGLKRPTSR